MLRKLRTRLLGPSQPTRYWAKNCWASPLSTSWAMAVTPVEPCSKPYRRQPMRSSMLGSWRTSSSSTGSRCIWAMRCMDSSGRLPSRQARMARLAWSTGW
ncbi:hypothetical protein D3C80_1846120 [compost metagenome]